MRKRGDILSSRRSLYGERKYEIATIEIESRYG
jgi:hypothetical protein